MTPATIPLRDIARFSVDGRIWRAFERFLAVKNGSLLAVPTVLAAGDFRSVVDGCPVPWHEVLTAVDSPILPSSRVLMAEALASVQPLLAALFPPHGWQQDSVLLSSGGRPVSRLVSPAGVIFCWVPEET